MLEQRAQNGRAPRRFWPGILTGFQNGHFSSHPHAELWPGASGDAMEHIQLYWQWGLQSLEINGETAGRSDSKNLQGIRDHRSQHNEDLC